jgi:excisionase family DNA binding protein
MSKLLYSHQKEDLINAARIIANEIIEKASVINPRTDNNTKENFMTQQEAAKFLKITVGTLIQWKKAGKVPFYKIGRTIFFSKNELLAAAQKK